MLHPNGHSLKDYPPLPILDSLSSNISRNLLILDESDYDKDLLTEEYLSLHPKMINEQLNIFNAIKDAVYNDRGGVSFVNRHGGTGKKFLWRVLTTALRSRGDFVLAGN